MDLINDVLNLQYRFETKLMNLESSTQKLGTTIKKDDFKKVV